jgi:hypothetical protein
LASIETEKLCPIIFVYLTRFYGVFKAMVKTRIREKPGSKMDVSWQAHNFASRRTVSAGFKLLRRSV